MKGYAGTRRDAAHQMCCLLQINNKTKMEIKEINERIASGVLGAL